MYEILRPEWLGLIPESYLTLVIMILVTYGVLYMSRSTIGYQSPQYIHINVMIGLIIQSLIITLYLISNNITLSIGMFNTNTSTNILEIILLLISIGYFIMLFGLIKRDIMYNYEYMMIILCSIIGMLLVIKANDLISLYLGIELQSLSFYVLAAYRRSSIYGTESGLKYYVMGGFASCILLLGIALVYGLTGLTNYTDLAIYITEPSYTLASALLLIILALLFKLAAAPFHMWAPDVYQGAPLGSTAFFSIVPKIAIFYALYQVLSLQPLTQLNDIISIIAILSILLGTIEGLYQTNIKRLLSYSSISHVGFILLGIMTGTTLGYHNSILYIIIYVIMTLGIFSILTGLRESIGPKYFKISNITNLSFTQPLLAYSLSIILFSMAGIPPLAGFFSKFAVLLSAIQNDYIIVSLLAILGSAIAAVYYIKLIQLMFFNEQSLKLEKIMCYPLSTSTTLLISFVLYFILVFFLNPNIILDIITLV